VPPEERREATRDRFGAVRNVAIVALAYAGAAEVVRLVATLPSGIAPIYPSAGIGLAAVLLLGRQGLAGIWLGSVAANLVIQMQTVGAASFALRDLAITSLIGAGAALGAWLGARLVRLIAGGDAGASASPLESARGLAALLAVAAPTAGAVSGTVGVLALLAAGLVPREVVPYAWLTWLLGDAFGVVVAAPLVLAWRGLARRMPRRRELVEGLALAAVTLLLCHAVFLRGLPLEYGVMPVLVWAAYRFGMRGTSAVAASVAILATVGTTLGASPFVRGTTNASLLALHAYLGVTVGFALLMAAILADRRRAEAEQDRLETQLVHSQKMEAIGRLAGGVAHDFNNLLTVIISNADLALEERELKPALQKELEGIRQAGESASHLTRQLLAFSRKQVLQPRVLDLNALVARVERMLRRIIGEDVELVVHRGADLWSIRADPGQMEQVLLNLAVNSRDAMPQGGTLVIETGNVVLDEEYARRHPEARAGDHVLLAVTDTGHGMDAATLSRIFEPFFTTKGQHGTGLGLSTVHGIVRQSGGHVWPHSEPGRGTTFKVYLPRAGDQGAVEDEPRVAVPERSRGETVLVVEDAGGVRDLVVRVLEQRGHAVLQAGNGEQALTIAAQAGEIVLLVTDVVLPGMSGRDLAASLARSRPSLGVLYMSGYTENGIVHRGVLDPGIDFVAKPFTVDQLVRKVEEILGRRRV